MESEVLKPGQCRAPSPSAPSARPDSRCPSWEEEPGSPGNVTAGFPGTRRMGIEKTYFFTYFSRDFVNLALENCMKPIISPGHMGWNNEISNNVIWICARIVYVRWGK